MAEKYPYKLKGLIYEYDGLSPIISEQTISFHRDKHLATYIKNLNTLVECQEALQDMCLREMLENLDCVAEEFRIPIKNNAGGVYNHNFYFDGLTRANTSTPPTELISVLDKDFGSLESFKEQFTNAALTLFGSGYAWLVCDGKGKLSIVQTVNQDVPACDLTPLLNIDVWEHAYYLDYQNRRADYIKEYYNIINWDKIWERYQKCCECK